MTLLKFIESNFTLAEHNKKNLEKSAIRIPENFTFKNEYIVKKTSKRYIEEISIQKELIENTGSMMHGYKEAKDSLQKLPPDNIVLMRFIQSRNWSGRVFYLENKKYLGVVLGKKRHPNWQTPPNWDGSLEMLENFNKTSITRNPEN